MQTHEWISNEFEHLKFSDVRLHRRFLKIAEDLARQPGSSINSASTSWAATKAAYRLFDNEKVSAAAILQSHVTGSVTRANAFSTVLAVQDTCFFDFKTHQKTEGLGKISNTKHEDPEGLIMHASYLLSPSGLPLGLGYQKIWSRERTLQKKKLWNIPIEEKESFKWLDCLNNVKESFAGTDTRVVHICDREADIYELFCEARRTASHFLIRAKHDRAVNRQIRKATSGTKLSELLSASETLEEFSFQLQARQARPQRTVQVALKCVRINIAAPTDKRSHKDSYAEDVETTAIGVFELNAPKDQKPLEWILLTNLEVETPADAQLMATWYSYRWRIEELHRIIKSGCKVEDCRLQSAAKLTKYISLMSIVAWRIHWITRLSREAGETPCSKVLTESEWKGLYIVGLKNKKLPNKPPSLKMAVRAIASLGGFLGRKGDGDPGNETIWRGMRALYHISQAWEALGR